MLSDKFNNVFNNAKLNSSSLLNNQILLGNDNDKINGQTYFVYPNSLNTFTQSDKMTQNYISSISNSTVQEVSDIQKLNNNLCNFNKGEKTNSSKPITTFESFSNYNSKNYNSKNYNSKNSKSTVNSILMVIIIVIFIIILLNN